jgi:membrane-associated phospholipid phosphatase
MDEKAGCSTALSVIRSWLLLQVEDGFSSVAKFQGFFGAGKKRDFLNFVPFPEHHHQQSVTSNYPLRVGAGNDCANPTLKNRQPNGTNAANSKESIKTTTGQAKLGFARSLFYLLSEIYFRFSSALGEEVTFVLLLPFLWWHFDTELSESVVFLWCFSCYVGHVLKDLLQLPRPYTHVVTRLEYHHECEYGLPSTHAIAATTLPLCISYYCYQHQLAEPYVYVSLGFLFWSSICLSRLYLGVHCIPDLSWGTAVGVGSFYLWINVVHQVEYVLDTSPLQVMLAMPIVLAALLAAYPTPPQWTSSYGDTATILGALNGGLIHLGMVGKINNYRLDFSDLCSGQTYHVAIAKILVGYLIVFMTRLIMKKASYIVFSSILPKSDENMKQRYAYEIPAKFINYSVICLSATAWAPLAMHSLFN